MFDLIVHETAPFTLLGGADVSPTVLNICLSRAQKIVAADGGADVALSAGLTPLAVIGDLDSLSHAARAAFRDQLHQIDDKDTTDFEKVLQSVQAPLMLAAGFLGGRLDHTFSVLNTLTRYPDKRVILVDETDVVVLLTKPVTLNCPVGTRIALLPMQTAKVTTTGLEWNLDDARMDPTGLVSSSNAVAAPQVTITPAGPVLLTLPLAELDAVIAAVHGQ